MVQTLRIDSNTHTYRDGSLYVKEQLGYDILDSVSFRAVDHITSSFAAAMRADYILVHDREVGVIIPRRVAHAYYRHSTNDSGRRYDKFGNTVLHAYTKNLVERHGTSAELVNIEYVAGPTRRHFPALPSIPVTIADIDFRDMILVGHNDSN